MALALWPGRAAAVTASFHMAHPNRLYGASDQLHDIQFIFYLAAASQTARAIQKLLDLWVAGARLASLFPPLLRPLMLLQLE